MTFLQESDDAGVLLQKLVSGKDRAPGPSDSPPLFLCLGHSGEDSFSEGLALCLGHFGQQAEHEADGGVALSGGKEGLDALGVPVEGNPQLGQLFEEAVGDGVLPGDPGDFVDEDLPNLPLSGQFEDLGHPPSFVRVGSAADDLFTDGNHLPPSPLCMAPQLGDLTGGLLLRGGDSDEDGNRDGRCGLQGDSGLGMAGFAGVLGEPKRFH